MNKLEIYQNGTKAMEREFTEAEALKELAKIFIDKEIRKTKTRISKYPNGKYKITQMWNFTHYNGETTKTIYKYEFENIYL